ncbi:FMN-binding negative transcriptional regulator [Pseudomonas oryzihabitans]|uniref:Transcriptional regulator n=1 Tax=Pseudomonas oryzihabitans TaxID=47885 RepID=A0AAJ2EXH2_9PSED|nr:FMN-binding negative transcriptional regulator [Pseudomonas psychrotolerans]MDR6234476.1 transcriptional regulator [Pseudomonas psychrotolerans]MDR6356391.1 transcriptional regulator [Pseudomonas psychrotolerans]
MYPNPAFRLDDLPSLHQHLQAHALALLVSQSATGPLVSHLPLWLDPSEGPYGTLYGHLARSNPQARALVEDAGVLAVFQGPQAYVSPAFYPGKAEHGRVVPTWNYQAVHARGTVEVFDDPERLLPLLERLTDQHEAGRAQPWQVADAPADYLQGMLRAIRGLRLPIDSLQGIAKLSQNRNAADREGVRQGLATSADPTARALGELMSHPS